MGMPYSSNARSSPWKLLTHEKLPLTSCLQDVRYHEPHHRQARHQLTSRTFFLLVERSRLCAVDAEDEDLQRLRDTSGYRSELYL
jgi:hypothetical protein